MSLMKKISVFAIAATILSSAIIQPANAGSREDDALIGGVVGLATGVILGSAITNNQPPNRPIYIDRYSRTPSVYDDRYVHERHYAPRRDVYIEYYRKKVVPTYREPYGVKRVTVEPWTGTWFDYCSSRYRSFNPRTGTYVGHDGKSRFCIAR